MIPCLVCGKDIKGGWWVGFPPAPDSQKIGLCPEHDTEQNRVRGREAWKTAWQDRLAVMQSVAANRLRARENGAQTLVIRFLDGGRITLPCLEHAVMGPEQILEVTLPDKKKEFYPLPQVRSFELVGGTAALPEFSPAQERLP